MRHHKSGRKLHRTTSHREAMLRNMAVSLFRYEQIRTTVPKAKELRRAAEPLITLGKNASVANRRLAFSRLRDRDIVGKLFNDLGVRFKDRPGGYLRILRSGYRNGDNAPMAVVQLVERVAVTEPEPPKAKATAETAKAKVKAKDKLAEEPKAERRAKTARKAKAEKDTKSAKSTTRKKKSVKSETKKTTKKATKKKKSKDE